MLVFHNAAHARHAGRHEMFRGQLVPCVEVPQRAELVEAELKRRGLNQWRAPGAIDMALLERVHDARYLEYLRTAWSEWIALDAANAHLDILPSVWPNAGLRRDVSPRNFSAKVGLYSFDAGSPITAGTWDAALGGAACAVDAARAVASGEGHAFVLTRPPGHHAGRDFCGGYCFLNNAALAAQALRDAGFVKVAVVDVDYHHGNGTQAIFYHRADVFTASVHGDPLTEYPFYLGYADERGAAGGEGANLNLPLPRGTAFAQWERALAQALEAAATQGAQALVVPLGVDAYEGDPISGFHLASEDFRAVGRRLASLKLPTVLLLEGGYAVADVGVNVANVLEGFL